MSTSWRACAPGKLLTCSCSAHRRRVEVLQHPAGLTTKRTFKRSSPHCGAFSGWSIEGLVRRARGRCCAFLPLQPSGAISNRRLVAADGPTHSRVPLEKSIASTDPTAGRRCGFSRTSSSGLPDPRVPRVSQHPQLRVSLPPHRRREHSQLPPSSSRPACCRSPQSPMLPRDTLRALPVGPLPVLGAVLALIVSSDLRGLQPNWRRPPEQDRARS